MPPPPVLNKFKALEGPNEPPSYFQVKWLHCDVEHPKSQMLMLNIQKSQKGMSNFQTFSRCDVEIPKSRTMMLKY